MKSVIGGDPSSIESAEDSFEIEIGPRIDQSLKCYTDFDAKLIEQSNALNIYICVEPKLVSNAIYCKQYVHNSLKNCVLDRQVRAPQSGLECSFYITHCCLSGISFKVALDALGDQKGGKKFQFDCKHELHTWAKVMHDQAEQDTSKGAQSLIISKWVTGTYQAGYFTYDVGLKDSSSLLRSTLLLQIHFQSQPQPYNDYLGLQNDSQFSYINSVIQVLYHYKPLRKMLMETVEDQPNSLVKFLQQIFHSLTYNRHPPNALNLLKLFPQFDGCIRSQQNIHEFITALLKELGNLVPETKVLWCGRSLESSSSVSQQQQFNCLQLDLINQKGMALQDVQSSLRELQIETEGVARRLTSLPPLLFMYARRHIYNHKRKKFTKVNTLFRYPPSINLDFLMNENTPINYTLYAVIVHKGRCPHSGHYSSFVNLSSSPDFSSWFQFNDTAVLQVTSEHVLQEYTGQKNRQIYFEGQYNRWNQRYVSSEATASLLVYLKIQLFSQHQSLKVQIPQEQEKRFSRKITKQQAQYSILLSYVAFEQQEQFSPFTPGSCAEQVKMPKNYLFHEAIQKISTLVQFGVGSVWLVNKKAKTIKQGNKYGCTIRLNLGQLFQSKKGHRQPDYLLLLPESKTRHLAPDQSIGILHIQQVKEDSIDNRVEVRHKKLIKEYLADLDKAGCTLTYDNTQLQYFLNGWNDYLFLKVQ